MSDDRRFRPATGTFDDTYRQHHGAGLVALVLRIADGLRRRNLASSLAARVQKAEDFNPLLRNSARSTSANK